MSHPSRGAWIEINHAVIIKAVEDGRTPRGVRGLKFTLNDGNDTQYVVSHPSRGAWIEIMRKEDADV